MQALSKMMREIQDRSEVSACYRKERTSGDSATGRGKRKKKKVKGPRLNESKRSSPWASELPKDS